jgi:pyruvate,water dikinase
MVIEAVSGSGEKLMNGHVSPDRAYISRNGRIRIEFHPGSRSHNRENANVPLAEADWLRIAELLNQLESAIGKHPLDMEWAIDDARKPWLLQHRTITTLGKNDLDVPPGMWTRRIADDLLADRLTPLLADTMVKTSSRFDPPVCPFRGCTQNISWPLSEDFQFDPKPARKEC